MILVILTLVRILSIILTMHALLDITSYTRLYYSNSVIEACSSDMTIQV